MNPESKEKGYLYHIEEDVLKEYQKKPLHLRLQWLYMGNCLRKECSQKIKNIQDRFRKGESSDD